MELAFVPYKKYFDFSGRARRKEYFLFNIFAVIILVISFFIDILIGTYDEELGWGLFSGIYLIFFFIPALAVSIRRLHDWDKSGWFLLLNLIPFVGQLIVFVFMCIPGNVGANRFGPGPKAPSDYEPKLKPLSKKK